MSSAAARARFRSSPSKPTFPRSCVSALIRSCVNSVCFPYRLDVLDAIPAARGAEQKLEACLGALGLGCRVERLLADLEEQLRELDELLSEFPFRHRLDDLFKVVAELAEGAARLVGGMCVPSMRGGRLVAGLR